MANAESQAFKSQFSTLLSVIDNPLTIAAEAYSRNLISRDVMDKMLVSTLTAREKAAILLTSVESQVSTNQQSFHEFVRVLKTQTNLVQTAEILQMECCEFHIMQLECVFYFDSFVFIILCESGRFATDHAQMSDFLLLVLVHAKLIYQEKHVHTNIVHTNIECCY